MRVITGIAKKKPLLTINESTLRPTTGRVKEAMFSIIQLNINNANVLDLFSGSFQLGIEALSRGAKCCTFIDSSIKSYKIGIQNLKSTKLEKKAKVLLTDGIKFLKNIKEKYDIVFLDPPYKTNLLEQALEIVSKKLNENGLVICEHLKSLKLKEQYDDIRLQKEYSYGRIKLALYKKQSL